MGTPLRELIAQFTVGVDDKQLRALDKSLDSAAGKLSKFIELAGTGIALKGLEGFFSRQIQGAAHVQDLAERLDVSATSMKEFGFAAATAGVGFDSAARALGFLERAQGQALSGIAGKESAKTFAEIGVSIKDAHGKAKPLAELLGDVTDAFRKLPNQAIRAEAATKLFGRSGRELLPLLDQGSAKIRALMADAAKLGNGLGDDYYKRAKAAREETLRVGYAFQSLKDRITDAALPGIMAFLAWVEKIETKFLDWTKRTYALETAVSFLAAAGGAKLLIFLFQAAKALGLIKATVWETITAFAGFAAPIALIGALYVAFDDLYTLMEGGQSEIGELLEKFEGPGAADKFRDSMKAAWADIKISANEVAKSIGDIFGADTSGDFEGRLYVKFLEKLRDLSHETAQELHNLDVAIEATKELISRDPDVPDDAPMLGPDIHTWNRVKKYVGRLVIHDDIDDNDDYKVSVPHFIRGAPLPPAEVHGDAMVQDSATVSVPHFVRGQSGVAPVVNNKFETHVTVPPGTTDPHGIAAGVGPALAPHIAAAHRDALVHVTVP